MRRKSLRRLIFFLFLVLLAITVKGQVALPHYDGFDYPADQTLHTQQGWSLSYTGTEPLIKPGSLSFPGLPESKGNKVTFDGSGGDPFKTITPQNTAGTKIFYSFIFQVSAAQSLSLAGSHFAGLQSGTTGGAMIWLKSDGAGGFFIGQSARSATGVSWSSSSFSLNTPVFIVACYEISGTYNSNAIPGDDKAFLWINPVVISFGLPGSPAPDLSCNLSTGTPSKDLADVKSFYIRQDGAATTPFIELDELRIGTSWKEVTSETDPPVWKSGFPVIENVTSSGFDLTVSLNERGKAFWAILDSGAETLSADQVKSGSGTLKSGNIECPAADAQYELSVEGLNPDTGYYVYFVAEDILGNLQSEPTRILITTLKNVPPVLTPSTLFNDVEHDFDLTFDENVSWRSAVISIKANEVLLTPGDWDNSQGGKLTIKPTSGNPVLTKSGLIEFTIIATGYNDAHLEQEIKPGAIDLEKSLNTISEQLSPGITSIISLEAKDQFENVIPEYVFRVDIEVADNTLINDEVYTINSMAINQSSEDLNLTPTDQSGLTSFEAAVSLLIDPFDGVSVQVMLNDGLTSFGTPYVYRAPGSPALSLNGSLDETTIPEDILTMTLKNEVFKDNVLENENFILNNPPEGMTVREVSWISDTVAAISFEFEGADFDNDIESFTISINASELSHNIQLTSSAVEIVACIETMPSVITNTSGDVGATTASWGGSVTFDGGENVTVKGVCYSTGRFPDIAGLKTTEVPGTGTISGNMTELSPNTVYYLRAYASNSEGSSYGEERNFKTYKLEPDNHITNLSAQEITETSIELCFTSSMGSNLPDGYLILGKSSEGSFKTVVDGIEINPDEDWSDGEFAFAAVHSENPVSIEIKGLSPGQQYDFKIYPFSNSGNKTDYKTNPEAPSVNIITQDLSTQSYLVPEEKVKVYPNPVNDCLIVETDEPGSQIVSIYSSNGRKILSTDVIGNISHIDVSTIKKGIYLIKIRMNGKIYETKFIKY